MPNHRLAALALVTACTAGPPVTPDAIGGDLVVVRVLDDEFVRFGERRAPLEELIYRVRVRCREVEWDPERVPRIEVLVPADGRVSPRVVDRLQRDLRAAGVRWIELGQEAR